MERSFRNSFTSGVLDEKLHARADLPQWRTGLKQGTNVVLLPHGGARRRPGMRYGTTLSEQGRLARFRFNLEQQYLLHFENNLLTIFTAEQARITRIVTPYPTAILPDLYLRAQTADTLVIFHPEYAPHRLLRALLETESTVGSRNFAPVRTTSGSPVVLVYHPAHDVLTGDEIGLSGLEDVGGLTANTRLNKQHTATVVEGTVTNTAALVWKRTKVLEIDVDYGVNAEGYGFRVGDQIKIDDATAMPGIPISQVNRVQTITAVKARITFTAGDTASSTNGAAVGGGGSSGTWKKSGDPTAIALAPNPVHTTSGSNQVTLEIDAADYPSLAISDSIVIAGLTGPVGGIAASDLNGTRTVTAVHSGVGTRLQFATESDGTAGVQTSTAITWKAANFYKITVAVNATSTADGGGDDGRVWALASLAPNEDRKVALDKLPQFNFEDDLSPPPKSERQIVTFTDFVAGEDYQLIVSLPRGSNYNGRPTGPTSIRTGELRWDSVVANNASVMQRVVNSGSLTDDVVIVTYEGSPSAGAYEYSFQFTDAVPVELVQVNKVHSASGTIDVEREVEGGSREEDVISDNRGWPAGGIVYQRRLWMFGLASRPSTILASQSEDFYNFETGAQLDSEAIDVTGEFDPIRHLVAERGLVLLTSGSEAEVGGSESGAITPGNIAIKVSSRYGSTSVVPISIAGRPMYVDSIARNIRQFGVSVDSASGFAESREVSILSQSLIKSPVGLELWRNSDGDYLMVVNDDGTLAVLAINQEQGVMGWTEWTTLGEILDVCEVDGRLWCTVQRTIGEATPIFLEWFDYDAYTDSCRQAEYGGAVSVMENLFNHLEGETVQVRADGVTMESVVVSDNDVEILNGDVPILSDKCEAGLAIPTPTLIPMPPQISEFSAIAKASVDLLASRGVRVNGYRLRDVNPGQTISGATPLITGLRPIQLRGYGDRQSITITAPEPQPMHVRAIEMEVV